MRIAGFDDFVGFGVLSVSFRSFVQIFMAVFRNLGIVTVFYPFFCLIYLETGESDEFYWFLGLWFHIFLKKVRSLKAFYLFRAG